MIRLVVQVPDWHVAEKVDRRRRDEVGMILTTLGNSLKSRTKD
jgi:hypothetical protein